MSAEDTTKIKERIISILDSEGPNFPSPIASKIQTSILFTSAFLSELLSEKRIKITNMKVGSSPVYYIAGHEEKLEPIAIKFLKSKEKDAFILLKEKQILKDKEQEPSIRVALRSIRDFAIPEEKNSELYWKYFLSQEEIPEIKQEKPEEKTNEISQQKGEHTSEIVRGERGNSEQIGESEISKEKSLEIFDNKKSKPKPKKKVAIRKKSTPKVNEKFFNKIKDYLNENQIEISDIVSFSKNDITLKVKTNEEEHLLRAYNKKSLREDDIIKTAKAADDYNLKYEILCLGEPTRKLSGFIDAIKKMKGIKKIN